MVQLSQCFQYLVLSVYIYSFLDVTLKREVRHGCHGQIENFEAFSMVYSGEEYKILVFKQQKTFEASSAKLELFQDLTTLVDNDAIFQETPVKEELLKEMERIKANDTVVACAHIDHLVHSLYPDKMYSASGIQSMLFEIKIEPVQLGL